MDGLYQANIVVITMLDSDLTARKYRDLLLRFRRKDGLYLVSNSEPIDDMPAGERQRRQLVKALPELSRTPWVWLHLRGHKASRALRHFYDPEQTRQDPAVFFAQLAASNVPQISDALRERSDRIFNDPAQLRKTPAYIAVQASEAAEQSLSGIMNRADEANSKFNGLLEAIERRKRAIYQHLDISPSHPPTKLLQSGAISEDALRTVLAQRLAFWRLPLGRAEDVTAELLPLCKSLFMDYEHQVWIFVMT